MTGEAFPHHSWVFEDKLRLECPDPEHSQDEDNPEIDPVATPEQYATLTQAIARRNQWIRRMRQQMG